jgi:glycosyltransferase involved in cell wall biosynthesis
VARILYAIHRFWPYMGGAERHFFELARRTAAQGHTVTVFTTDAWDIEHLNHPGKKRIESLREETDGLQIRRFRVRHLPRQRQWFRWLSRLPLHSCRQLFGYPYILVPACSWLLWTMRQRFDLVHAGVFPHTYLMASAYAYCRRQQVPLVCQPLLNLGEPHSAMNNPHFLSAEQLWLLLRASAILTNTAFEKEVLMAKGISGEKLTVAGPGVTPAEVLGGDGTAFRQRYRITGPLVLQISTQTFDKGSVHTVEALKLLWERGLDITLVMIGQVMSDFAEYLMVQAPSVRQRLMILDYVSEEEKKDALAACDLFVMPSRADSFGIVYLEAWLYKKPVIGCHAGGVPRVIDDGQSGFLVPFGDCYMLAEYISMLLSNPFLAARMGEKGYQEVVAKYSWEQSSAKVQEVYRQLLAEDGK